MNAFSHFIGRVCPIERSNIDTDAIIPKQFLKSIQRTGYGPYLFDAWRYTDHGEPGMDCTRRPTNPDFVLNQPRYQGAGILLAGDNFGCGSSREHAAWALENYGFRVIIAPSFADIFFSNAYKNGLLPIVAPEDTVARLFRDCAAFDGYTIEVDLPGQSVTAPGGVRFHFDITPHRKHCLLEGLDEIGVTLTRADDIRGFEARRKTEQPWLFG